MLTIAETFGQDVYKDKNLRLFFHLFAKTRQKQTNILCFCFFFFFFVAFLAISYLHILQQYIFYQTAICGFFFFFVLHGCGLKKWHFLLSNRATGSCNSVNVMSDLILVIQIAFIPLTHVATFLGKCPNPKALFLFLFFLSFFFVFFFSIAR